MRKKTMKRKTVNRLPLGVSPARIGVKGVKLHGGKPMSFDMSAVGPKRPKKVMMREHQPATLAGQVHALYQVMQSQSDAIDALSLRVAALEGPPQ